MSLSSEEKQMIKESLQIYLQLAAQQAPKDQVTKMSETAQGIIQKLDTLGKGGSSGNKPAGITQEWYDNVCKQCNKLGPSGCEEKITEKYPGKCDPILHYEQNKASEGDKDS
ncbi:MAG: hypothetical protein ACOCSE_06715 [Chitinivibrionales bacterium]